MKVWKSHRFIQYEMRDRPWESWFAWRPVTTISGKRYWWTTVYRKSGYDDWLDEGSWKWYFYADDFDLLKEHTMVQQFTQQLHERIK